MSQVAGGPPGAGTAGTIRLVVRGGRMSVATPPEVLVDGHRVATVPYRRPVDVPVTPGRHRVEASAFYVRRYGQAALEVDVPPGGVVPVHYAVPWTHWTHGSIGLTPQRRRGLGGLVAVLAGVLGVFVALVAAAALTG